MPINSISELKQIEERKKKKRASSSVKVRDDGKNKTLRSIQLKL